MSKQRRYLKSVCLFFCFAVTIGIQLWNMPPLHNWLIGDDSVYHYLRVDAVAERLRCGDFFSEVNHVFFEGFGYADFANPILFLYIPALFRVMGCGIGASMTLFLILCCILTYVVMYVSVKNISGSPIAGTIAAVLYSLSQYRTDSLFTRFALGEVLAFIFWPLVLWGLYDLIAREGKRLWPLGLGLGGMLLSHSLSTYLVCLICVIFCLVFIKRIVTDAGKWQRLLLTAGLTLALTAFYWIPFLRFVIQHDLTLFYPNTVTADNTVDPVYLFSNVSISATQAGIGAILLFAASSRLLLGSRSPLAEPMRKDGVDVRWLDTCLLTGLITLFCATDLAPWKLLGILLNSLQFSFRLYTIVTVCLAVAGGICLYYVLRASKVKYIGTLVICAACILSSCMHYHHIAPRYGESPPDDYFYATPASRVVCNGEWLPLQAKKWVIEWEQHPKLLELSDGTRPTYTRARDTITFPVEKPCAYADLPLVWYHDYKAYAANGQELPVTANEQGLVRVDVTDITGDVTVTYVVSFATKAAYALSFITAASLLTIVIVTNVRRKKKTPNEDAVSADVPSGAAS
ncbi:MAG: hypothetical protein E7553_04530 [Ruminococcaceae bacterium]|nr:hypothetical protein [Oscillospiraceae bacterium]